MIGVANLLQGFGLGRPKLCELCEAGALDDILFDNFILYAML